ncbi:TetR/AcrR family transcriptional regulator [Shimwellia pseudoproteus]|uniref:TetR/AcrR family transcriptional regulator n=1 Tax=Shimwellia pseudoproteus TaxID=570012 RepID=UPI0018EAF885|nr:TetR/AcrR family transcriptional regulator [Shimwellia pseudoproteus]MBJ3816152.1 TetR/AcrR family transcriptional regulator [Shimwellia pseudoproteus]
MADTSLKTPSRRGRPRNFDRDNALIRALEVFWHSGYELASVGELCKVMAINPPSLYAAFGSKAGLFLEAVNFYETTYWDAHWAQLLAENDVHQAIANFFHQAAFTLTSQQAPCGCLVVLAAINVSPESAEVYQAAKALRERGKGYLSQCLQAGVDRGQLPGDTDVRGLAMTLNTLLQGMSVPAQDGVSRETLDLVARHAVGLLPPRPTGEDTH